MQKIFAVIAIGAALALSGCGKKDEKTVYSDGKNTVSTSESGDHMTITGQNGDKAEFSSGASAAAKLPAYAPLYPGASVTSSFTGSGKDGSGGVVAFHTKAAPADVIAFYKDKTAAGGLAQSMNADMNGTLMFAASKDGDKTSISVTATKGTDGTDAQITWGTK
ncbi:MAG: hypothetical protein JOZ72_16395 [Alphaproteobacteria bacterium]|nr:hypothetical protein [Alphaproteobacteria bacterium]